MTRFLAALIVIYMLVATFAAAFAQDGAHTHPAYEQALKERKDVDAAIGQEIIDLKIQVNENLSSIVGLEEQVSEILLRLEALEETGSGEPVDPPVEPEPVKGGIQVGAWFPQPWNVEQPYANLVHASGMFWYGDGWSRLEPEHIDSRTGLPKSMAGNSALTSDLFFPNNDGVREWNGDWVLKADCTGNVRLNLLFAPSDTKRLGNCHLAFTRDYDAISKNHYGIQIANLDGTIANLRLCRAEDMVRCDSGTITSSRFEAGLKGYTDLRFMDLQSATTALIRSVDDQATIAATQWGVESKALNGNPPFVGMPMDAPFIMAVENGVIAWLNLPMTLGAPAVAVTDAGAWRSAGRDNALAILQSEEWDRYADALVASLIRSGYPEKRVLKIALANEVWNFASLYQVTTNYAWGVGEGLRSQGLQGYEIRTGYGALSARFRQAFNDALARAGRKQAVRYIIESQAAWDLMSADAIKGARWYVERSGENWETAREQFGLSVASYWAAKWDAFDTPAGWNARIAADPAGTMDAFRDFILTDPADFGAKWVFSAIARHKRVADETGVNLTDFYEGGSHLERPDYIPREWFTSFLWGEHGAEINETVNRTLRDTYPDLTLSNYVLAGAPGSAPWLDGLLSAPTPMMNSWKPFMKKGSNP